MQLIDKLADYSNPNSLGNKFRNQRFTFFQERLDKLDKPIKILDIGGTQSYWVNRNFHDNSDYHITILNLYKEECDYKNLLGVKGNATNMEEFGDKEFDLVYSNSVIEHLFNIENQKMMANEILRVGKFHFIQTPNRYFFIEPHFLLPYFQFYPKKMQLFILSKTKLSRGKKADIKAAERHLEEINLLSVKKMKQFFPKSQIYREKFLGITKSITAYNLPD